MTAVVLGLALACRDSNLSALEACMLVLSGSHSIVFAATCLFNVGLMRCVLDGRKTTDAAAGKE